MIRLSPNNTAKRQKTGASTDAPKCISAHFFDKLLGAFLVCAVLFFVAWPMLCIIAKSLHPDGGVFSEYAVVWDKYRQSLCNSLFVGLFSAVLCTLVSLCCALFLSSSKGWKRGVFLAVILIALVSPPFVSSLSYIQLYGRRGWITHGLLGFSKSPYNRWGIIAMQTVSFAPVNIIMLRGLVDKIDRLSITSARDLGASPAHILSDIVIPSLFPGIAVSLLLTFVRSCADFSTPIIIGGRFQTLASDIYLQIIGYSDLPKASAMNMYLLVPSLAAFYFYRRWMRKADSMASSKATTSGLGIPLRRCGALGVTALAVTVLYTVVMVLQYGCVILSGFLKSSKGHYSFTLKYFNKLLELNGKTMLRSVEYALIIAIFGSIFAILFAYYMDRRNIPGKGIIDAIATTPYMIPGTCFGLGYILAFNHAPVKLTGTAIIVLANMLFKQLPTTTKLCSAALSKIPREPELAVSDLGGSRLDAVRDVIIPNMRSAFLSCFIYNFSSSMTTAGAILFLISARRKLAVFELFEAVYTGEYAMASMIATSIIVIVLAVEGIAFSVLRKAGGTDVSGIEWNI